MNFKTLNEILTRTSNLADFSSKAKNKLLSEMEEFEIRSSQWKLNRILKMELRIYKYNPLRGATYIPLPKVLANKKAIINVQNDHNKCFMWSVLSSLQPVDEHSYCISKYKKWENEFDEELNEIEYPVKLSDVPKFVTRINISTNVYCHNNGNISPL